MFAAVNFAKGLAEIRLCSGVKHDKYRLYLIKFYGIKMLNNYLYCFEHQIMPYWHTERQALERLNVCGRRYIFFVSSFAFGLFSFKQADRRARSSGSARQVGAVAKGIWRSGPPERRTALWKNL